MRRRARIHRVEPGRWCVERPCFGFGPPDAVETFEAPTRREVCAWLAARGGAEWTRVLVPAPRRK